MNVGKIKTISTDTLLELAHVVLKNNFFEFNDDFYQQLRGTAIGTKCAPSYAILFLAALEEKLLADAQDKPWVWWRYIDDIFLIWQHGEKKLIYLNNLITDLFTKPTDTHQLLHRASCHPNHTKKGIPYSQALRIRRICSEEQFFVNRVADLKTWLLARGYGENEVDSQIDRVRAKDRAPLLDTRPKEKDDMKIPFALTYHPAMHKVYEILRKNQNLLLVDKEHEAVFKD